LNNFTITCLLFIVTGFVCAGVLSDLPPTDKDSKLGLFRLEARLVVDKYVYWLATRFLF